MMIRKLSKFLFTIVALVPVLNIGQAQSLPLLTHHVRAAVLNGQAKPIGQLPSDQVMTLHVVLQLSDRPGLQAFLKELYNPASPSYRHFVTPAEFTERFGPSQANYDAVVHFVEANGFTVVGGSRDGMDVLIKGTVATIQSAFHVTMSNYQDTAGRTFYAIDREPTVNLAFPLWHISGLDNASFPHPMYVKKSDYAKAHAISEDAVVSHATTGSGPSASFLGSDMRAAYYGGTALTGAGQNLGLFEYLGTDLTDLTTYFKNVGQTNNVPITLLSTDGTSTSCVDSRAGGDCDDTEQTLDMTQAIGMAPGLASLVMYIGSTDSAIISPMTTHSPLPTTIGCSWGWTPADPSTLDPYFEKMSSQGQNFFAASGDSSTWSSSNEAWPADDANVVSVGGTDLVTSSAAGPWKSETAWSDSGGGISPDSIPIPAWQQISGVINSSNKGSTTLRNGPDVSANANFTFYVCADQTTCTANDYGGTSFATPMWAGFIALVNQQLVANGQATIGFINPTIYAQNVTSDYATDFHDITSGTSGSYSAVTGYDLVTGWGSPTAGLITALSGTATPSFTLSASPTSVSVVQGSSGTSTITSSVTGGFDSAVALTASGQPTGVTVGFSPTSITGAGTSTATFTVASTTATGTYTITVTGTSGSTTKTTSVSLTVTAAPVVGFTLSASPTSVSVVQGNSGTSTITSTATGGFDSAVTLSASGQPTGVTVGFSPASITGTGTSTMTLTVASTTATGTYSITVTGTSGSTTETTSVSLTVTSAPVPAFTISASPTSVSVVEGNSGTSTITTAVSGGFNSAIALSASGQPTGVTVSFSPTSIAAPGSGTSTMTMAVASTTTAGTYTITVTGTGGSLTHTATVSLTVTATSKGTFTISVSPTSGYLDQGQSGYAVVTTRVSGGFDSAISFSATGIPSGVTGSFSPTSIGAPGSGSTDFTLTVAENAPTGTYPITITGTGGGVTKSTTLTFQVRR
jgi:kumamolisin